MTKTIQLFAKILPRKYKYDEYDRAICFVCNSKPSDILLNDESYCASCYLKHMDKSNEKCTVNRHP